MHVRSAWEVAGEIWLKFLKGMVVEFVRRLPKVLSAAEVIHSPQAELLNLLHQQAMNNFGAPIRWRQPPETVH
jgi:hypothetical protein